MANLNFKLVLQAVDRITAPVRRIGSSISAVTSRVARFGASGRQASRGVDRLTERATLAGRAGERLAAAYRRVTTTLSQMAVVARGRAANALGHLGAIAGRTLAGVAVGTAAVVGAGFGAGISALTFGVIGKSAEFEQFLTRLSTIEGSMDKAKASLAWVKTFGKETPYEVAEVLDAFVKLKAYGIDPTDGALRTLGDTAAGMGKDIMDAVEMLADAQTGEFERLKEFGIRASAEGKKVTFTYTQGGKDMAKSTEKSAAAIRRTLLDILDTKFKGGMEAQAKTWNGMLSNLGDAWVDFQLRIGEAGVFELAKNKLKGLLDWVAKAAEDGRLQAWAEKIGASISPLIEKLDTFGKSVDWVAVARGAAATAGAFVKMAEAIGKAAEAIERLGNTWRRWRDFDMFGNPIAPKAGLPANIYDARQRNMEERYGPLARAAQRANDRVLNGTITIKVDQDGKVRSTLPAFDNSFQTRVDRGFVGGGF
jgi:phage tail tape-measure protein